jgi:Na+/H+-dicarboxylate symporter
MGRIAGWMAVVFVLTGLVASVLMIAAVKAFDPARGLTPVLEAPAPAADISLGDRIAGTITTPDFADLLSRRNMLALIVFSILTGVAANTSGDKGQPFRAFLASGVEVMSRMIRLIMLYAPVGLGAYFAYMVGVFGPQLMGTYARAVAVYYPAALVYFAVGFTAYAWMAAGRPGVARFWTHIPPAALTAWGTGSSLAALPANLEAAARIGVSEDVRKIVLPLGATIHMDGSALAAVLKIAVLFAVFGREFSGVQVYATAIGIALLSGTVMSGIPGGGFLGEMLIVTLYGFGPEALPIASMLGVFVDPPATMINASGDTAAAMLIGRLMENRPPEIQRSDTL